MDCTHSIRFVCIQLKMDSKKTMILACLDLQIFSAGWSMVIYQRIKQEETRKIKDRTRSK